MIFGRLRGAQKQSSCRKLAFAITGGDQLSSARMAWGAGASDLIYNLLNDSKHRRGRAEQRLRESGDGAQPQHGMR